METTVRAMRSKTRPIKARIFADAPVAKHTTPAAAAGIVHWPALAIVCDLPNIFRFECGFSDSSNGPVHRMACARPTGTDRLLSGDSD